MGLEEIIPAIALIAVLILVFPNFLETNMKKKIFFQNLSIWGVIVLLLVIIVYFVFNEKN